jgi:hypothetical protein
MTDDWLSKQDECIAGAVPWGMVQVVKAIFFVGWKLCVKLDRLADIADQIEDDG